VTLRGVQVASLARDCSFSPGWTFPTVATHRNITAKCNG
jgi:hypothetical protein